MRQLQPVLWTKGTLLTPQHLQLQDRFLEDTLRFRLESLSFAPWGFSQIQIDREALAAGMLAISSAAGILRDGLLFEIPDADAAPPPKPLADCFGHADTAVEFYLAIPSYRDRGINISVSGANTDTRYVAEHAFVRDEVRGSTERPVQLARKGFWILAASEQGQGYSALRVARVERTPAGSFHLDEKFLPPLIDIASSEHLMTLARRLLENLTARSTELSALRREKNSSLADFTSTEIASFWLLYTVNTHYTLLRHIFDVSRGHPEHLYSLMLSLGGALTTFSNDVHPRDFPVYNHEDLGECFTKLDRQVQQLLDAALPKHYVSLAMQEVRPSIYAASLAEDRLLEDTRLYLAIRADVDQGALIGKVPQMVKIGSASYIDHLVRHAVVGVELTYVSRPPTALPIRRQFAYFSLGQSGDVWNMIVRNRNIAAWVPGEFPGAELELLVMFPRAR